MFIDKIEISISTNVNIKKIALGLNFFDNSTEFGINKRIIVPINANKLNFIEPFSNENLNLSIIIGSNPFNPNIDFRMLLAVVMEVALK